MHTFCTLFDSFYLSRGLAMYESLKVHNPDFHLYIFPFDDLTNEILLKLHLDKITVVSLNEFETDELRNVKKKRSKAEYCWTCTPSIISYVLENFNAGDCTYVDSDLFFYSDPTGLISEMYEHAGNVLITEHRYSFLPRLYEEKRAGRFCVQFMTFVNKDSSRLVLDRWRKQCINWCYARHEDGKFGDQKYLDEWPVVYDNIHILENPGGGIAPWNLGRYLFEKVEDSMKGRVKSSGAEFEIVFFHFQYVKFLRNGSFDIGWYLIPPSVKKLFYEPYIRNLQEIENKLKKLNANYNAGFTTLNARTIKDLFKKILKQNFKYNIIKLSY